MFCPVVRLTGGGIHFNYGERMLADIRHQTRSAIAAGMGKMIRKIGVSCWIE
jgi:hypothetical protein